MTGTISALLAGFGVVLLASGTFAALALNSVPLAIAVTAASFGAMGLLTAWVRLRGRFRYPRPRPLTGWRIPAAALLSLACGTGAVAAALSGSVTTASVLVVLGAVLGVRCAVARRAEQAQAGRARRTGRAQAGRAAAEAAWTDGDEEILRGDVSLPAWKRAGQAPGGDRR